MSYDLAVWDRELGTDSGIYIDLCESKLVPTGTSLKVSAFYNELTTRWSEIDTVPQEQEGNFDFCPWSCALDRSGMHVVMACVWPKATAVATYVSELATKHDLVLYDPQGNDLYIAGQKLKKKRSWWPF